MGDEGISYRESVALFGYPISELFVDPEAGFESQSFERAIFEYLPEHAGTEFEVLLVRLGEQSSPTAAVKRRSFRIVCW